MCSPSCYSSNWRASINNLSAIDTAALINLNFCALMVSSISLYQAGLESSGARPSAGRDLGGGAKRSTRSALRRSRFVQHSLPPLLLQLCHAGFRRITLRKLWYSTTKVSRLYTTVTYLSSTIGSSYLMPFRATQSQILRILH